MLKHISTREHTHIYKDGTIDYYKVDLAFDTESERYYLIDNQTCEPREATLHFTVHGGKLTGLRSVSSFIGFNRFCVCRRINPDFICNKCYAAAYTAMRKALRHHLIDNHIILECIDFDDISTPIINDDYFRIESFGDISDIRTAHNYLMLAKHNPNTRFGWWTKNADIIADILAAYGEKAIPKKRFYDFIVP